MRIGILSSSGGSVLSECLNACGDRHTFFVATDRSCETEQVAAKNKVRYRRLTGTTNEDLSREAKEWFEAGGGVDFIILFYLRIATSELIDWVPTFNIHPSLLPAYQGFNAIDRALADGSRFLGATLHVATDIVDGGNIIAQACVPINPDLSLSAAKKISFLQKTYLAMLLIQTMEDGTIDLRKVSNAHDDSRKINRSPYFNPALEPGHYLDYLSDLFGREGYRNSIGAF